MKQHGSLDYPVAVYRIDLNMMYLNLIHWHWHSEIELIVIKEGAAEFSVGDNMYVLSPGDTLFINRNVMHSVHPHNEQNCIFHSIVFSPNYIFGYGHSVFSSAYLLPVTNTPGLRSYVMNDKKEDDHSISMLTSEIIKINLQKSFGYELLTKSYLIQIWLLLLNHIQDLPHDHIPAYDPQVVLDESRTKAAITYIMEHYEEPITLQDIADSIHISKSECCRCFKRCLQLTPFDYLLKYRIYSAVDLLAQDSSTLSISDIALKVGFNSSSYFNKLFKNISAIRLPLIKKYWHRIPNISRSKQRTRSIIPVFCPSKQATAYLFYFSAIQTVLRPASFARCNAVSTNARFSSDDFS